jgi:hypothetical protein
VPALTTDVGLRVHVAPDAGQPETVKFTVPVYPLTAATVIVEVPGVPPDVTVSAVGLAEMVKSGDTIDKETCVVCVTLPLMPLIVSMELPAGVVPPTLVVTVSVEVVEPFAGGVTGVGLIAHVAKLGQPVADRPTALLNPPTELTVMVDVPDLPCATGRAVGLAESEKSAVCGPQAVNLNDPMRVLQLKAPSDFRYSLTYQNVQSSLGSMRRAL